MFQSTHPRGVRHRASWRPLRPCRVSIHAPAWGATLGSGKTVEVSDMFQSTHPRGVRPDCRCRFPWPQTCFNPRTRVGCDVAVWSFPSAVAPVSIHAPAWGATGAFRPVKLVTKKFQSTHPRGVRRKGAFPQPPTLPRFNPRTRVGCDQEAMAARDEGQDVSIHAPAWGATGWSLPPARKTASFNPRTRVGCDLLHGCFAAHAGLVSIHAPAWGATRTPPSSRPAWPSFNPRTRVGCDTA